MQPRTDPESSRPSAGETPSGTREAGCEGRKGTARGQLRRLAPLLGDESAQVRAVLRREFAAAGRAGRVALRKAARSSDARRRAHARSLLLELERRRVVRRLVGYALREELDLERGLLLLGRFEDPHLDARRYQRALRAMAKEVSLRAARREAPLEQARVLVEYLGGELGFNGDGDDYHHPANVHLHRCIERRRGLPLTLVALYLAVARRANLRVGALPLPGHVMLRLYGREQNQIVDPFQRGRTKTQAAIMAYLSRNRLAFKPSWFRDASDTSLLRRQVHNLVHALETHGQRREAAMLTPLVRVLAARERSAD